MIVYNIITSIRSIIKDKIFSFFNLTGFAFGFTVCILISLFVFQELTVDTGFLNNDRIYRLVDTVSNNSKMDFEIAGKMKEHFPEIMYSSPVFYQYLNPPQYTKAVNGLDFVLIKELISTNNDFFNIFSLPVLVGDKDSPFSDLNSIVLTQSTAIKIFGKIDCIGEIIKLEKLFEVRVSAVIEDFPENSSLNADAFFNSDNQMFRFSQYCNGGICYHPSSIYILTKSGTDKKNLSNKINSGFPENKSTTHGIFLQMLTDIYLSQGISNNENRTGSKGLIVIFITIAILVLLLSAINYTNFTILRQIKTLKGLGVRIVNGANPGQLKLYCVTETTLSVIISFLAASYFASALVPVIETLLNSKLHFKWIFTWQMVSLYSLIILSVVLVSVLAPVYIINRVDVQVLFRKKGLKHGKRTGQRGLTIFQIAVSAVLLICLIFIQKQLYYVKRADLGFNKELLLKIEFPRDFRNYSSLKQQINNLSFVKSSSLSLGSPGVQRIGMGVPELNGVMFNCFNVDKQFLQTYGIELLQGREFLDGDLNQSCYINETAFKKFGWNDLENRKFNNGQEGGYKIIGVVKDFNVSSLHNSIGPVCLLFTDKGYGTLNIKLLPGDLQEEMEMVKKVWEEIFPENQMSYTFVEEYFNSLYLKEEQQGKVIGLFTLVAFIITCLGLYGQVLQVALNRTKEIGIRRVNGATVREIISMLNKEFLASVIIAYSVALPLSFAVVSRWLENFAFKTRQNWWIYFLTGVFVVAIVLITVTWQSWRAATRNPVEALRYE